MKRFRGVYNLYQESLDLYQPGKQVITKSVHLALQSSDLEKHIGDKLSKKLRDDVELITEVYPKFQRDAYLAGELAPVFFGSALNNFGVKELLDCFVEIARRPDVQAEERTVNS